MKIQTMFTKAIKSFKSSFLIIVLLTASLSGFSQNGAGFDLGDPDATPETTNAPLDGSLSVIVALGAGYAIKKARDERKQLRREATDTSF